MTSTPFFYVDMTKVTVAYVLDQSLSLNSS